jgi:hypothetical protein
MKELGSYQFPELVVQAITFCAEHLPFNNCLNLKINEQICGKFKPKSKRKYR